MLPRGRSPAEHVDIFWNKDLEAYRITEVEVIFIPRSKLSDEEFQAEYSAYNKRWNSDLGKSTRGWLTDEGYTPEIVFGHMFFIGFASPEVLQITGIINGQRGIAADTALRLGHWFGMSAEFRLNLQPLYELRLAQASIGHRLKRLPTLAKVG